MGLHGAHKADAVGVVAAPFSVCCNRHHIHRTVVARTGVQPVQLLHQAHLVGNGDVKAIHAKQLLKVFLQLLRRDGTDAVLNLLSQLLCQQPVQLWRKGVPQRVPQNSKTFHHKFLLCLDL